jgi:ribulose bisphosphate carboxylase small subunit
MIGIKRLKKRKTAEIVVNKPKLLLAHEDDNTTSSLLELQKKGYSWIYI